MGEPQLSRRDLDQLRELGVSEEEARRQIAFLASPPPLLALAGPATVGDGILRLEDAERRRLEAEGERAQAGGRLSKFVPASGAATRMFRGPLSLLSSGDGERLTRERVSAAAGRDAASAEVVALVEGLPRLAFCEELAAHLAALGRPLPRLLAEGEWGPILAVLLGAGGLGYAELPKGLIPFHRYPDGARTAFEEHLAEARLYLADAGGRARAHFTVSPDHEAGFRTALARARSRLGGHHRFEVTFSHQDRATDTVALGEDGGPARLADGSLLLRPGGHGSLLGNLASAGGDLVAVQNIDNVLPERSAPLAAAWRLALAGLAAELQRELFAHLEALAARPQEALAPALEFSAGRLGLAPLPCGSEGGAPAELAHRAARRLERPLRVCAMVPNRGEPGGGPFWVQSPSGDRSLQIVEASQVGAASAAQQAILRASTHFNPVDLVCAPRDRRGRSFDLARFTDPSTAFVSEKTHEGRPIRALEHPGLWNGGMAGWLTVFVEVPGEVFAPVKSVLDLLRPEHQP